MPVEYRAPVFQRGLALFALLVALLLALVTFLAWRVEGSAVGAWTLPLWASMAGYWFWQWRLWAQRFVFYPDRLMVLMPGHASQSIPYATIQDVQIEHGRLHLITAQSNLPLRSEPNTLAHLATALLDRIPALRQAQKTLPKLPLQVDAPRQPVIIVTLFGLLIGALGVGLGNAAFRNVEFPDRTFALLVAGVMVAISTFPLYWLLVGFVWRYTFDRETIQVQHTLRTVTYDPAHLCHIAIHQQDVTNRGFTKTLYTLRLVFDQDASLIVQPGAQNYPFDYADALEKVILHRLLTQLETMYTMPRNATSSKSTPANAETEAPTVTTRWLDPKTEWQPSPGTPTKLPDFIVEHYSQPADLRVMILNYGERQPGAEDVVVQLSRPVAGQQLFHTTNGDAAFSASGDYLLLAMPFLLIVIDAHTMQAWHYPLPNRTMLLNAGWEGDRLRGAMLAYGKRTEEAETLGPWEWAEIIAQWSPGVGPQR
ncbi:MAG: hypothetical protein DYG89_15695 [Caldilinea sp. CFX5]|nr:hypothetical protein [Caldilinea sp. CFX5]